MSNLTISQLIGWYVQRRQWITLSASSKRSYLHHLTRFADILPADQIAGEYTAEQVDNLFEQEQRRKSLHAAVTMCRIAKRMFNVARRYPNQTGVVSNPFEKMGLPALPKREVIWTEDYVWDFYRKSIKLKKRGVGLLAMLCYTFAQRPVDMRQLKWENVKTGVLLFKQQKTGVSVRLFMPEFINEILKETPKLGAYICCQDNGEPFDDRLYNIWAYDIKKAAHIPMELKIADLRKTAFTEMGDNDASDQELMSYGHLNREELSTYTLRSVAQSKKASDKRFGNDRRS